MIIGDLLDATAIPSTGEKTHDAYKAKKYAVMVDLANDGTIEGGEDVTIDGTMPRFHRHDKHKAGATTPADPLFRR